MSLASILRFTTMHKYVIITPAKNEEQYITFILDSVVNQTRRPLEWIIVDDGSSDNTAGIVDGYSEKYRWIRRITKDTVSERRGGGSKVVRAFMTGLKEMVTKDYDFVVKLDADLTLPNNYFEVVANGFEENGKIGLCGGICVTMKNGKAIPEKSASYHLRGPIKSYRSECFRQIGGLREIFNWDGVDEMLAMYHGWQIKILDVQVIHHRPTSTLINNEFADFNRAGEEYYKEGYDLVLALVKAATMIVRGENVIRVLFFAKGFIWALFKKEKRYFDDRYNKFARRFQYNRIRQLKM